MGVTITYYYPGAGWPGNNVYWLDGYPLSWPYEPAYNSSVDPYEYGRSLGLLRRSLIGGAYVDAFRSGSRSSADNNFGTYNGDTSTTRGCIYFSTIILGLHLMKLRGDLMVHIVLNRNLYITKM